MTKLLANNKKWMLLALLAILIASAGFISFGSNNEVDYSADVKPILNKKCISCHGGVQAKSGFSLLFREDALAKTESGKPAIVPGDPSASEMIRRITHDDPEERMPYQHEPLSKEEIRILKNWIKQGAKWGDHWAYLPVQKQIVPEAPEFGETDPTPLNGIAHTPASEIDAFIRTKLEEQDLKPSAPADKPTILRRVSLDLIGIYPEAHISKKFLQSDGSQQAYQALVDSLLASPRFGERWASVWLDLARYADTKGYESDGHRDIWPYRDWVIRAFNNDMPYDQFLTEQMAGDLLPSPTKDQYIATAFHRNSMTNDEGGTDNEEFRIAAVMDRVNTTWEATMGTTFSCVQCHSHPYDPFRHDEYYKFVAYFNNTRDEDVPGEYPWLRQLETKQEEQLENILAWIKSSEKAVGNRKNSAGAKGPDADAAAVEKMLRFYQPAINSTTAECIKNAVIGGNNYALLVRNNAIAKFKSVDLSNAETMTWQFYSNKKGGVLTVRIDSASGPIVVREKVPANEKWQFAEFAVALKNGEMEGWRDGKKLGVHDIYVSYDNPSLPKTFNDGPDFAIVFNWIAFTPAFPGKGREGYESNKKLYRELLTAYVPGTPILLENPANLHRTTNLFERGNRMTPGKEVQPAVPNSLQIKGLENLPPNRLGMAKWMTDKRHPLVSRTIVNRLWEQLFGSGIVETLEDMGTQGIAPTHRELLDHLSWKLMHQYNWSLKSMLREMVMSATYRQQSRFQKTEAGNKTESPKDPFNKFYSRGPRTRLSAEQIRDQHLFVSGLIDTTMFGKGVMPWQPDGIWLSPYNGARWEKSSGGDQYRRAIYTYWKRTSPYPSLISFDAAQRVVCNARRIPTNTPLQALVTLNDSAYVDMSRHFARRIQSSGGSIQQQIGNGYQWLTFKPLPAEKAKLMMDLYDKSLRTFRANPQATCEMVGIDDEFNNPAAAALVVVAGAMMNLDEVIMKN